QPRTNRRAEARTPQKRGLRSVRVVATSWRAAKYADRGADADRIEKRNCILFRHPHTAMRRGIAGQISSVHSVRSAKPHEIMHRRRDKFSAGWNRHVGIGIGYDRVPSPVNDLAIHTGIMCSLFLDDLE